MARTIVIAAEGTTHLSIEVDNNHRQTFPVNKISLDRVHNRMVLRDGNNDILDVDALEVTTPSSSETLATGQVALGTGATGSVDSIKVNGEELLSEPVSFNTTLSQTATDVALAITNNSNHKYVAVGSVANIDITAPIGSGNDPNAFVVLSVATIITTTDTDMTGGISKMDVLAPLVEAILYE